jgi:hypothetical protein
VAARASKHQHADRAAGLSLSLVLADRGRSGLTRALGFLKRRSLLLALRLFFLLGLLQPVSLGTLEAIVGFAHEASSYPAALGLDLRKIVPGRDWACTRLLCEAIQAQAAAALSKLPTVVALVSGIETPSENPPASSGTTS